MVINGKALSDFNAVFISFVYSPSDTECSIFNNGLSHFNAGVSLHPSFRDLVIVFEKENDLSNFYGELLKGATITIGDGLLYDCLLTTKPSVEHIGCRKYRATFTLSTLCKGSMITQEDNHFTVVGNAVCYCIYEITTTKDLLSFTVDDYTITNLKANRTFVINGVDKLVYYKDTPEISAFDDTDLIKFPILEQGEHVVKKSDDNVDVVIKYYPAYL